MNRPSEIGIGDLARQTGCSIETIRYYERIGVIPRADRSAGRYRRYRRDDVTRVRFVRRARELGFSLNEVRALVRLAARPKDTCVEVRAVAAAHLADVQTKITDLRTIQVLLAAFIRRCKNGKPSQCPIIEALSAEGVWGVSPAWKER